MVVQYELSLGLCPRCSGTLVQKVEDARRRTYVVPCRLCQGEGKAKVARHRAGPVQSLTQNARLFETRKRV